MRLESVIQIYLYFIFLKSATNLFFLDFNYFILLHFESVLKMWNHLITEKEQMKQQGLPSVWFITIDLFEMCENTLATAKSLQSCPTLWDLIDGSPPGSPVPGILQARTLEWVVISFSNAWKWKVKVKSLSRVRLLATPWTAAYQAPPSMGFSRQSTGVGCHCLLLGCLHTYH